eukprot:3941960-Rhodomonas_salina.2
MLGPRVWIALVPCLDRTVLVPCLAGSLTSGQRGTERVQERGGGRGGTSALHVTLWHHTRGQYCTSHTAPYASSVPHTALLHNG